VNSGVSYTGETDPRVDLQPCFKVVILSWRQSRIDASRIKKGTLCDADAGDADHR
jgi:hypothetical protein